MIDRQTETDASLLNRLLGAAHAIDGHFQRGLVSIKILLADSALPDKIVAAFVVALRER